MKPKSSGSEAEWTRQWSESTEAFSKQAVELPAETHPEALPAKWSYTLLKTLNRKRKNTSTQYRNKKFHKYL